MEAVALLLAATVLLSATVFAFSKSAKREGEEQPEPVGQTRPVEAAGSDATETTLHVTDYGALRPLGGQS